MARTWADCEEHLAEHFFGAGGESSFEWLNDLYVHNLCQSDHLNWAAAKSGRHSHCRAKIYLWSDFQHGANCGVSRSSSFVGIEGAHCTSMCDVSRKG